MRYHVFIADYDGTIAEHDRVSANVINGLQRLRNSSRRCILVTGRQLEEIKAIFPDYALFDRIVAENGAVLYDPSLSNLRLLGEQPPESLINNLKGRVIPFTAGHVIIATWTPHEMAVLEAIKETGLEYQVIFNKGAVMILPPGINKATGLLEALNSMGLSTHNAVAVGDAENDNAMLQVVECAVAVNNALPQVKHIADWITDYFAGEGVIQLIDQLIKDDLAGLDPQLKRHYLELGRENDGRGFSISPYGNNILVTGSSGSGKTTLTAAFLEKMIARNYQFCLIDPEGDYHNIPGMITFGDSGQPPIVEQVVKLLAVPNENVAINLLAVSLHDRPDFFRNLFSELNNLQKETGHPHFLVIDEAHHLLPCKLMETYFGFPMELVNILAITTRPELLCHGLVKRMNIALVMGDAPMLTLNELMKMNAGTIYAPSELTLNEGDVLVWEKTAEQIRVIKSDMPQHLLMRHKRKYAAGNMADDSFYFRGPDRRLNLKANNLMTFIQMADGVDDETWLYHLHRHDYSNWFKNSVKDADLAQRTANIELTVFNAAASRKSIFDLIHERYTGPDVQ